MFRKVLESLEERGACGLLGLAIVNTTAKNGSINAINAINSLRPINARNSSASINSERILSILVIRSEDICGARSVHALTDQAASSHRIQRRVVLFCVPVARHVPAWRRGT